MVIMGFTRTSREHLPLFFDQRSEVAFARVQVKSPGVPPLRCDVVAANGRISSLEFSRSPSRLRGAAITCTASVLVDMSQIRAESIDRSTTPVPPSSDLSQLGFALPPTGIAGPASESDFDELSARFTRPIPADYSALLRETNGFRCGQWRFFGTRVRSVVQPDGLYLIVAEDDISRYALGYRQDNPDDKVYLLDQIDGDEIPLEKELIIALQQTLASPPNPDAIE
ncbi:MAG TPA: SMI1/KNR4 family protein [Armatimonadota bacterium]|jgi:hypothetical protein